MAAPAPVIRQRFFDSNGDPLAGGKLYTYKAGTSTPLATYVDDTGSTPNTNPVILDSNGEANVWLNTSSVYKFILKDSDDVTQWSVDDVTISGSSSVTSGWSALTEHSVTDGQSATDLSGETLDTSTYSSALYEFEIIRGTTVFANGRLAIQVVDGTARVIMGGYLANEAHGVTFSVTQSSGTAQLKAALDSGAGNGTIKLSRRLIAA